MVMVVLILIGDLKVNFTAWLNLTTVENSLIRSAIISLVVTHIEFAHIRPPKVVLTLIGGFSGFYRLVEFYRGQKPSGLKGNIQFSVNSYRVRPYPTT